ncbi:MAG: acyl-CoA thioesterase [Candidatus Eremiobacteraeota bacterium]|nr:acyl-CoA thioesterase [Candidatus Eremiobacteraeota bacterium]MBV8364989.1 acyl-CoA thioesterase [Candidatus Eremiobacteraeota bacterium]
MRFHIDEPVRWSDVDAAGVVYFGAFVRFFEIAEEELFRAAGVPYGVVFDRFDIWLPRVKYACEFRAPARLGETLHVCARVPRIGEKSIALQFTIDRQDGVRVADCEIVLVCVDRADWKGKRVPDGLRTALAPFME